MLLVPQAVLADVIALRDGTRLEGIVANRELVAAKPRGLDSLSILLDSTGEYRQILVVDVKYVLLVDGEQQRLVEFGPEPFSSMAERESSASSPSRAKRRDAGVVMITFGVAAAAVGIFDKFGDPKVTVTETEVKYEDTSYNGVNYVLMALGGMLIIGGIILATEPDKTPSEMKHAIFEVRDQRTRFGVVLDF